MFLRAGDFITNQDSETQNLFEKEEQNTEGNVTPDTCYRQGDI